MFGWSGTHYRPTKGRLRGDNGEVNVDLGVIRSHTGMSKHYCNVLGLQQRVGKSFLTSLGQSNDRQLIVFDFPDRFFGLGDVPEISSELRLRHGPSFRVLEDVDESSSIPSMDNTSYCRTLDQRSLVSILNLLPTFQWNIGNHAHIRGFHYPYYFPIFFSFDRIASAVEEIPLR